LLLLFIILSFLIFSSNNGPSKKTKL
jgi:hypothetical protein